MGTLNIHEFKEVVEFNIDNGIKRSILGLGASGIGKSAIIAEIAEERNMKLIDLRLLLYTETELKGIPFPSKDNTTTEWLQNDILPRVDRDGERGILLIEELTSASKKVQAAAYQLIYDRRLNSYQLPDGWYIVALGNRKDDNGVYADIPAPLANRFEIHEVVYDLNIWRRDFAIKAGVNDAVISYLNFNPAAFHTFDSESEDLVFASPRSWVAVSDILNTGSKLKKNLLEAKISANIGEVEASRFIEFMRLGDSIDIVNKIIEGAKPEVPKEKDRLYIICTSIVNKFKFLASATSIKDLTKEQLSGFVNTINWVLGIQPEFITIVLGDLAALNKSLVNKLYLQEVDSDELLTFIAENKYLFE